MEICWSETCRKWTKEKFNFFMTVVKQDEMQFDIAAFINTNAKVGYVIKDYIV